MQPELALLQIGWTGPDPARPHDALLNGRDDGIAVQRLLPTEPEHPIVGTRVRVDRSIG